ncbi:MAG: DUF4949 domain-containing protein [Gammaproteobacteria bacterium]|nr:DUF4949 domain-containing protein [Gammaproteobacteria bacterium]
MKFLKSLFLLAFLFISLPVMALSEAPTTCPRVDLIKARGFLAVEGLITSDSDVWLAVWQKDEYGTNQLWQFGIGPIIQSKSTPLSDALSRANQIVQSISEQPKPTLNEEGEWMCVYHTAYPEMKDGGGFAYAMPMGADNHSSATIANIVKRHISNK